jgi:nitroreductase
LYIVASDEKKEAVRKAYNREWFKTAPLYIVVCGDHGRSWKRSNTDGKDHCDIDAAILSEHICLATEEIGLGTCWVCNFDPVLLKSVLNLPETQEPIALFPLGYVDKANSTAPGKNRKPIDDITKRV